MYTGRKPGAKMEMPNRIGVVRLLAAVGAGALCGCATGVYPPPAQRVKLSGSTPAMSALFVPMNELAGRDIVDGILANDAGTVWRWTRRHPRVRVWPDLAEGWQFHARLTVVRAVLDKVGSQTVTARVNERSLESRSFQREGTVEFDSPIPAGLLRTDAPTILGLDIDGVLKTAEGDDLGVLLHEIGLRWVAVK